jgi:uncharacterized protein (DUF2384 family)
MRADLIIPENDAEYLDAVQRLSEIEARDDAAAALLHRAQSLLNDDYAGRGSWERSTPEAIREVRSHAEKAFGDRAAAGVWLYHPLSRLNGRRPVEMLGTEEGRARVLQLLEQIEYGLPL